MLEPAAQSPSSRATAGWQIAHDHGRVVPSRPAMHLFSDAVQVEAFPPSPRRPHHGGCMITFFFRPMGHPSALYFTLVMYVAMCKPCREGSPLQKHCSIPCEPCMSADYESPACSERPDVGGHIQLSRHPACSLPIFAQVKWVPAVAATLPAVVAYFRLN